MLLGDRTSTECAIHELPNAWISRATVWIVEAEELGSGGNGPDEDEETPAGGEVVLAATTTRYEPSKAKLIAICRPMPN